MKIIICRHFHLALLDRFNCSRCAIHTENIEIIQAAPRRFNCLHSTKSHRVALSNDAVYVIAELLDPVFCNADSLVLIEIGYLLIDNLGAAIIPVHIVHKASVPELNAGKTGIAVAVSFILGIIITIAEPDLQVLANQVPAVPNMTLILTVAVGVGIFLSLAVLRIVKKIDLSLLLIALYMGALVLSFFVPKDFIAVAFDSGGVTTGPITVPFIMAMGIGISSIRGDKDASNDSFGLVALSSVGPILAVAILGCFFRPDSAEVSETVIHDVVTMRDVFKCFAFEIPHYAKEVFISIAPIVAVYFVFQLLFHRYHRRQKVRILIGLGYTYIGLVLFLCGVNVGFAPVGSLLGSELAGTGNKWILVPIGALIGYFIVKAEPAIQLLNHQVQNITNGAISAKSMNLALSIGVSFSVALAMLRIILQIPVLYILIPGYIAALLISRFVPKIFVGIAFDSGGVASGPMTSTFLLPICSAPAGCWEVMS